ncbi:PAS domain-containing protein [Streptomyces sp. NPDC020965]|uniref:PAS domain-containing protein n=1 Tax=Streptomyces sp. NPDC020965 TaxID=3365105 RepID=UPI00379C8588
MESGVPPRVPRQYAMDGRMSLAVVVVDGGGLVSHWSPAARRLFGPTRQEAVGRTATDLLPVTGALAPDGEYEAYDSGPGSGIAPGGRVSYATAGRARLSEPGRDRVDVLWWAYPMVGPGDERLLVLAADATEFGAGDEKRVRHLAPGFGPHTESPGSGDLARGLPELLSGMTARESTRIVSQVLDFGCPVLEFGQLDRVPVAPGRGISRHASGGPVARRVEELPGPGNRPR